MTLTDEQKQAIYTAYMKWANQLFDDLDDKSSITAEELVYKVISLCDDVYDKERGERNSFRFGNDV